MGTPVELQVPPALPAFSSPEALAQQPAPDPQTQPAPDQETAEPKRSLFGLHRSKQQTPGGTPTPTCTPESGEQPPVRLADPKQARTALIGIIGLIGLAIAWGIQLATKHARTLREPTKQQASDIATPLASLAGRHIEAGLLNADLADVIRVMSATGHYATAGPLIIPKQVAVDDGVPDDIQED